MIVQDACIDVIGGRRVWTASGGQKGSPRGYPNPCAGSGEILRRDAGRKETSAEAVAASAKERRWFRRHRLCLPLTMSVFNQGGAFQAQMVSYGQDGICAETGHPVLPGTSIHLRVDTREVKEVEKAALQGLRTTALGEVKWCRPLSQDCQTLYRIGIQYYPYY
jgi:hypothetical protein